MRVVNNAETKKVKKISGNLAASVDSSKLEVEIFKYFGNAKLTKTSKSPTKKNKNKPIIILPQMRKTRLKSVVYVENMENVLPDGEYDISKEDFASANTETQNTNKTPPKHEAKPARRRSIRLTSEVLDRHCLNNLLDGELVATSVPADNLHTSLNNTIKIDDRKTPTKKTQNTNKTPPKNEAKPTQRRSIRLKSQVLDRHCLNNVLDCEHVATTVPADNLHTSLNNTNKIVNRKTPTKKRKMSTEEPDDTFLDSINAEAIAEIICKNSSNINKEFEKLNISKRRRTITDKSENLLGNSCKNNSHIDKEKKEHSNDIQTENCNRRLENDTSLAKTTHNEMQNTNKLYVKRPRTSSNSNNKVSNDKYNQVEGIGKEMRNNSNQILNNLNTKPSKNQGILKYFKVQNKQSVEQASSGDCSKSQENVMEHSETGCDRDVPNNTNLSISNKQNSVQISAKRSRGRPRLSLPVQSNTTDTLNSLPKAAKRGRGRPRLCLPVQSIATQMQNSPPIPVKRGRGRPPLSVSRIESQPNSPSVPAKRGRGRPPLNQRCISNKEKSSASKPPVKSYTKLSKLTKEQTKCATVRKIPQDRLEDVLTMIDDENHFMWNDRNTSCTPYIFQNMNQSVFHSDHNVKIKYARQFLLRRDWINLSKILGLFNETAKIYYPLLSKYAALLLAHTDKEQFNAFIQFLTKLDDSSAVIKKCTTIATVNK